MTTIVLPISRIQYLDQIFACLEYLECNAEQTNLLGIVDGDINLYEIARNKIELSKFNDRLCVQYKAKDKLKNYDIMHRRRRISDIHNFAKQYIQKSEYIFCMEDDTTFRPHTLEKLRHDYSTLPFAGMIQGYALGRHGIPHFGSWNFDEIYEPRCIVSQNKGKDIQETDAGGLYCTLTKAETYMAHTFEPFHDGLGPDVNYGIELRRQGYKNYTDWTLPCIHHTKDGDIIPNQNISQQVQFIKTEHRWRQKSL